MVRQYVRWGREREKTLGFYWIMKLSGTVLGPCCYMALHLTKTRLEKIQFCSKPVESSTAALRDIDNSLHLCILQMLLSKVTYSAFRLYMFCQYVCSLGIEPTIFCATNTMLYHWATGTVKIFICYSHPCFRNNNIFYLGNIMKTSFNQTDSLKTTWVCAFFRWSFR